VEEGGEFSFGGAGDDLTKDLTVDMDGTIAGWWGVRGKRWRVRIAGSAAEEVVSGGRERALGAER
jgi:hypothetical protein